MVGRTGLLATYDIARKVEDNNIEGCFVECGVARGGCSVLMAMVAKKSMNGRKMWLFDSFEGLPKPTVEDGFLVKTNPGGNRSNSVLHEGYCLGTFEQVANLLFSEFKLDKENVIMVKGWFQDTLPGSKAKIGKISFLRMDGDWYSSTKCCLENLYDNVVTDGYIFIDDYHLAGCRKAVDEFLHKNRINVRLTFDDRGGSYFNKP